ncbi:carboxylesterase/lipase family protein [Sunxiuqinia indica]|uniref:carboxylesterase/lipase family protein n=1 Tax=Sunxiuqinia indica TaxID=2692584 RepID=UPI00135725B5|nr:carboxylesterase family protein [Sunxiuqinia indica]
MKSGILFLLIASFFISVTSSCTEQDPTIVETQDGIVQGLIENDLRVFKGIPFAAPPVGDLRWKAPQTVEKWDGIKQVTQFAPSPFQWGNPPAGKSEDCLYLNVWTPAKSEKDKLPVMVWIYGGGFGAGTTADPVCNGTALAKKDVVVVAVAYRVGILGFLAHPELSAENPNKVSGNYGLLDQIAGLKWVKENIEAFGGDPEKVTIFGESAGGISVSMLCASPEAKGLFSGAISQSGGSFGPTRPTTYPGENMKTLQQAEADGEAYVQQSEMNSIAELRKVSADQLPGGRGWPIVDGHVIPDVQTNLYKEGNYNDVPVLIGYNSDEGLSFARERRPEEFIANVKTRYGKFADQLVEAYPPGKDKVAKTARDLMRDAAFGWQTWIWARLQSQTGNSKVFYYYFDQHPDYPEDSPMYGAGSPHGQDVAYAFMTLDSIKRNNFTESDRQLSETMGTYWTNFAKYGDPNGEGVPEWSTFSDENPNVMYLTDQPHIGPVPSEKSLKVLDQYFKWRMTPEGTAWAK